MKQNALDFTGVREKAGKALFSRLRNAEEPYVTATFYRTGSSAARAFYIGDPEWVVDLFRTARRNSSVAENEIEEHWHEKINVFWEKNPPVVTPRASPRQGQGDAGRR